MQRLHLPTAFVLLQFASAAFAQATLEFKYPDGEVTKWKETVKFDQVLTIAGMEFQSKVNIATSTSQTNGTPNSDGQPVAIKTDAMTLNVQLPMGMGNIQFDSANPNVPAANPMFQPLLDALRASTGGKLTYTVGKDRKVVSVEGHQEIIRQAPQAAADELKRQLNPEHLMADFQNGLDAVPSTPVKPGDTWNVTAVVNAGGEIFTFDRKYTYEGTVDQGGKQLDKIKGEDLKVRFVLDPNSGQPFQVKSSDLKVDSSKLEILFDREAGRAVSTSGEMHITGDMTFVIDKMELPGKMDLQLTRSQAPAE